MTPLQSRAACKSLRVPNYCDSGRRVFSGCSSDDRGSTHTRKHAKREQSACCCCKRCLHVDVCAANTQRFESSGFVMLLAVSRKLL